MSNENTLRKNVREAIEAGRLPNQGPARMWGGPGVGARCTICERPIGRDEVEFELQFARDGNSGLGNHHLHVRCFAAWELERETGADADRRENPSIAYGLPGGHDLRG